ncbi:MAG: NAD(P)/FAD-dependent oxidoreductase [Planctomycetes bacterium]|nr:NAD(P)/FAD-dependent oxidoreductase [Planctomycetota bacterium]
MAETEVDAVIVGGGVVGLAVLQALAGDGREAVLFERHPDVGRETSSRNSEVLHGGMYYRPGSLKARLSVAGRRAAVAFCQAHNVPYRPCGKMVGATTAEEVPELEKLLATGRENGVEGLCLAIARECEQFSPGVRAVAALHSPATGVLNAHDFMNAIRRQAEADGGMVVCGAAVDGLGREPGGWNVSYTDADGPGAVGARTVVNAAGLAAQAVMHLAGLDPEAAGLTLHPCKGSYFSVQGEARKRIGGLVYPVPEKNLTGLGVHTVVDVQGGVKLGPDICYVEPAVEYDYSVDSGLGGRFYDSVVRYLPFLRPDDLAPDMAGMRPKLSGPGQPARDFYIAEESARGLPGFINLAGIESPGLTASLAIGRYVADMVGDILA